METQTPAATSDPSAALEQLRTERLAGTVTEQEYYLRGDTLRAQMSATPDSAGALSVEQARAAMDSLRIQRIENHITQADYFAAIERLSPTLNKSAEQASADAAEREVQEFMTPANPEDYAIPHSVDEDQSDEYRADLSIRQALSDASIPKHYGIVIYEAADSLTKRLADATPEIRATHCASFAEEMQQKWGDACEERFVAIDKFLIAAARKNPALATLAKDAPWMLADPAIAERLWDVVKHQTRRA
jgi:hypothetical protein